MDNQNQSLFFQNLDYYQTICLLTTVSFSLLGWVNKYIPLNFGKNSASFLKILLPNTLSWIVFESPNLILAAYFIMYGKNTNIFNIICVSPFIVHYINRVLIYPVRNPSSKKIPLEIVLSAGLFTTCNAYLQTTLFLNSEQNQYSSQIFSYPTFYLGWAIFILGMYINISSDNILADMKKDVLERQKKGEKKEYQIPVRGLFKYVTQANYFGEVVELFGYGLLSWSFQGFWFFFTTLMILASRARDNHDWYLRNFKDYPKDRKIIIPYLY